MPLANKRGFITLLLFFFALCVHAGDGKITLIHIGDIHGHLIPRPDMRIGQPHTAYKVGGLAYMYSKIKHIRQKQPNNLLINTGDTIQGSAEALFSRGEIIVDILNRFQIDAYAPGNWDYLYGTERFLELFAGDKPLANWHAIAANLYYTTLYEFALSPYPELAGQRVLPPYMIKNIGRVNVGIISLTSDRGPQVVSDRIMDGFFLTPGLDELTEAVPLLREKENVDLVIVISERGLAVNLYYAERVEGIDVILSSDMHEETRHVLQAKTGTLLIEEGQDGTLIGELNLVIKDKKIDTWNWTPHSINTRDVKPDVEIQRLINEYRKPYLKGEFFVPHVNPISSAVLRTPIDTVIGFTKIVLHRSNFSDATTMPAVIEGSSHNFIADAFKVACDADVGVIRGFRYGTHIAPGPIKLEDIYHFIPVGPQIACGMIPGSDIKRNLEHSADGALSQWVNNWDGGWLMAFSGVTYDLDPGNEAGFRVSNLRVDGERYIPAKMYKMAGFWYINHANKINQQPAWAINVLKDEFGGILDATDIVAYYLQTLPNKTVDPRLNRIRLTKPLPPQLGKSKEIQPLRGVSSYQYFE